MKKLTMLLMLFCASLLLAEPKYGGTLVFGRSGDATAMDPAHTTDGESIFVTDNIFDNLVQFKYGSTEIEPALAKSWDVSADGLEYTFYLREGVYFAPTKFFKKKVEFTADDVVFSFKRQFDKSHPFAKVGGAYEYWINMDMDNIVKDVVKVDKYTVKFLLKKPEAPFLANIAMDFAGILSKEYAEELMKNGKAEDLNRLPVGTGPFVFEKWIKDDRVILTANKEYWGGRPYLDRVILRVIPNASVRTAELKTGQIQILEQPNPAEVKDLTKDPNVKLIEKEGMNVGYLAMNTNREMFKDLRVRQAINHAVNKKAIVDAVYEGFGKVAYAPIPPNLWSFNDNITKYEYDVEKAKALLKEAGYENGFEVTLYAMPVSRPYIPDGRKVGEAIQSDLAKVGIKAKIVSYDWVTYLDKTKNLEHDMCLLGWTGDNGDPDNFLNILLTSHAANVPAQNYAAWKNPEFDKLVAKAKETSDVNERTKLYQEAQEVFAKDVPWVTLANSVNVVPVAKFVEGFKIDPVGKRRFKEVWLNK
ncbi:ABC transporter substrate-binding protein [Campylobacter sp. MOP51]|uniref:ABC transporter substrate-binding protein n=1 Tax=Campylobacter canis TaxID=3378588 RepID=UPI003C403024